MKVVILAGGAGTRLSEETDIKPKPIVEIGGKPILWHIMKIYSHYGYNEFIICLGYKGYIIKEYFANYFLHQSDVTFYMKDNRMEVHNSTIEPWRVTLVDTGLNTMTGGRIKKIAKYVNNEAFLMTYGDGVGNVNISELVESHRKHGKFATITAVQTTGRFGAIDVAASDIVRSFNEKPKGDGLWVNGGFFMLEPQVFEYIKDETTTWEREPLENLARDGQLIAYRHGDFWKPMDTLRDKVELENFWNSGSPPWKVWKG